MPKDLPDLAVRRAAVHRRLARHRGRRAAGPDRHRARPPGGGHRQVAARRRGHRPDPRRRLLAGRLQPGRHPAGRGGHQAGARHRRAGARGGPGLRHRAARAAPRAGRLRRPDGGGLAALRREHLDRAARLRHRGGPGPRPRTSTRCARSSARSGSRSSARPACSTRAAGSSRRPGTSTRTAARPPPGGARKRPRTTGTSPSPTWCRWPRRASGWRSCAPSLPELPAARRARLQAEWGLSDLDMAALAQRRRAGPGRADRRRRARPPADARKWWLGELARRANEQRHRAGRPAGHPGPGGPGRRAGRRRDAQRQAGPPGPRRRAGRARASRTRSWPPAAWPWSATTAR